jgi:hypothetical protein
MDPPTVDYDPAMDEVTISWDSLGQGLALLHRMDPPTVDYDPAMDEGTISWDSLGQGLALGDGPGRLVLSVPGVHASSLADDILNIRALHRPVRSPK